MMSRDNEAPSGRNMAWYESKVETSARNRKKQALLACIVGIARAYLII